MASHSGSTVDISEQLYGTRPSVWHRWHSAKTLGDIHREIDECYLSKVVFRKWFDEKGKKLITGALENPRMVLSINAATRNAFLKKGSTTRVEASSRGKMGQTKMRRSSLVASLMLSTWHTKKILQTAMCNACCSMSTK